METEAQGGGEGGVEGSDSGVGITGSGWHSESQP